MRFLWDDMEIKQRKSTKTDRKPMVSKSRYGELFWYLAAGVGSLLMVTVVLQLWRAHWQIPFYYQGSDFLVFEMLTKGMGDHGWPLQNPSVGAPGGLELYDFPLYENLHLILLKGMLWMAPNFGAGLNLLFLATFPLAALSAFYVLRHFEVSRGSSLVASLLFSCLPYHFYRGQGHLFLSCYYLIPLAIMVCLWLCDDSGWAGRRRLLAAGGICLLISAGGIYYGFFTGCLLLAGGLIGALQRGSWRPLLLSSGLILTLVLGLLLNLSPTLRYWSQQGRNPQVAQRSAIEADFYALRLPELLLPINHHRVPILATLKQKYLAQARYQNEGQWATLGLVGTAGFLGLILALIRPLETHPRGRLWRRLGLLNLAALMVALSGGLGYWMATLLPLIRCYNRMSIFIGFLALFAVALGLDWLSQRTRWRGWMTLLFAGLVLGGLADQTQKNFVPQYEPYAKSWENDADFVSRIEKALPAGSMIFQLPAVQFPESPNQNKMADYELFRGSLHSHTLRWSYGAMKGRATDDWQQKVAGLPVGEMIQKLKDTGFSGVYIDRWGYPDRQFETQLAAAIGTTTPLVSQNQRQVFYSFEPGSYSSAPTAKEFIASLTDGHQEYQKQLERIHKAVNRLVPAGSTLRVFTEGEDSLLKMNGRVARPFPQETDGTYAASRPENDADAIAQFEALRKSGARYVLIPAVAFWWLDSYPEFYRHLQETSRSVARDPDYLLFELSTP